jgi:Na+/melibiose symporter-like transporter
LITGIVITALPSSSPSIILREAPYLFLTYTLSFIGVALLCGVLYLQSGIKENEIFLNDSPVSIKKSLSSVIKNKDFLLFLGLNLFISMSNYFSDLLISHPVGFVEPGFVKTTYLLALEYILPLSTIVFILLWRKLSETRDIKSNLKIGVLFLILASLPLVYINPYFIFLIVILQSIGRAAFILYNFVFLSSIIDASELKTKSRRDGTHFGFYLLIGFLSSTFSIILYPFINIFNEWRILVHYDPATIFNFQIFLEMNLANFITVLILLVISLILLQIFSFNTEKVKDIEDQVEKLHKEKYEKLNESKNR